MIAFCVPCYSCATHLTPTATSHRHRLYLVFPFATHFLSSTQVEQVRGRSGVPGSRSVSDWGLTGRGARLCATGDSFAATLKPPPTPVSSQLPCCRHPRPWTASPCLATLNTRRSPLVGHPLVSGPEMSPFLQASPRMHRFQLCRHHRRSSA